MKKVLAILVTLIAVVSTTVQAGDFVGTFWWSTSGIYDRSPDYASIDFVTFTLNVETNGEVYALNGTSSRVSYDGETETDGCYGTAFFKQNNDILVQGNCGLANFLLALSSSTLDGQFWLGRGNNFIVGTVDFGGSR